MMTIIEPWEYVITTFREKDEIELTLELDGFGKNGWELVAFDFEKGRGVFKRRVGNKEGRHAD